ncbi:MAG TPA: GNAT family acetyltransferase [Polyangiales bacterium]|nr:GNAT family acetyltransferase [Polyangiales bacterium]
MTWLIRGFRPDDERAVIGLWQATGLTRPWNDPGKDIARKLRVQPELFVVGELKGELIASAMAGYDGHRGSLYYLAVAPAHQRRGHARALLAEVEARLRALGCPKLNLQVRADNGELRAFYERLGYQYEERLDFGKRFEHEQP